MKEQKINWQLLLLLMSLVFLSNCSKVDRTNPYDEKANLNPDDWAPTNFKIESFKSDTITLSWESPDYSIEGFKIALKINDGEYKFINNNISKNSRRFSHHIDSIEFLSKYYYTILAYANNNFSVKDSLNFSFNLPSLTSIQISNVTVNSALCKSGIISKGDLPIISRGICWSKNPNPNLTNYHTSDGFELNEISSSLTGLESGSEYYIRAYATNGYGTSFSVEQSLITFISDFDGNTYKVIKIGDQYWSASNLIVTHYTNGEQIPNIVDNTEWQQWPLISGAWCYYDHDNSYDLTYGKLYNWNAISDNRKICPEGWHIPTDLEWNELILVLGGESIAGERMKSSLYWNGTNDSGFNGLPGGIRNSTGSFGALNVNAFFWSSTENIDNSGQTFARFLAGDTPSVGRQSLDKRYGFSVRFIKD